MSDAYSDDDVLSGEHSGTDTGDTLAQFIAREVDDMWDYEATPADNKNQVCVALAKAIKELQNVEHAARSASIGEE